MPKSCQRLEPLPSSLVQGIPTLPPPPQDLGKPTGELKIMEMHNYSLREDVTQQSGLTFGRAVVFSERTWLKQRSFNSRLQRLGIHVNHPGPSFLPCFRRLRCQRVNRRRPRPGLRVGLHGDSPTTNALINTARQPHTHTHVPEYVGNATATPILQLYIYILFMCTHTHAHAYTPLNTGTVSYVPTSTHPLPF